MSDEKNESLATAETELDALLELFLPDHAGGDADDMGYVWKAEQMRAYIYSLKTHWIPIAMKRPKEGQRVLCYTDTEDVEILEFVNWAESAMWSDLERPAFSAHEVTHWAKLPSQPRA